MGSQRDYYADLELPRTADVQEIKKQFRKLALKYHPDRNPGREQEVNSKFQLIQSAHEVLGDPNQKAQYDATLSRSNRYPAASGVKGNPWQNVSQQFPTPPRRNPPQSGAQRWNQRFASGVPPTAKQQTTSDSEAKKNAARAFESMRGSRTASKPTQRDNQSSAPPPPPRSETARQRAQASFGNRKPAYPPRANMPGDEPQATGRSQSRQSAHAGSQVPQSVPMPDPLAQFRDREDAPDPRQSSPYTTHGGEKTNPFDGVHLSRAKSTREPSRRDSSKYTTEATSSPRQRSSSVPKASQQEQATPKVDRVGKDDRQPHTSGLATDGTFSKVPSSGQATSKTSAENNTSDSTSSNKATHPTEGSSMYAQPQRCQGQCTPAKPNLSSQANGSHYVANTLESKKTIALQSSSPFIKNKSTQNQTPSGDQRIHSLTPFERRQRDLLAQLISNMHDGQSPQAKQALSTVPQYSKRRKMTDISNHCSFNFSIDDDTFSQTPPRTKSFSRNSVDDINTKFSEDRTAKPWQFSAGGSEAGDSPINRSPAGSRTSRRSPTKRPSVPQSSDTNKTSQSANVEAGFNPSGWSDKFGPQTFEPPPKSSSASPTRAARTNSKKQKATKTAGGYAVVEDESSDDEAYVWPGRKGTAVNETVESPQAMDIDSPTPTSVATPPPASNGARKMNVEPSRPEWRSGNINNLNGDKAAGESVGKKFQPPAAGSEDSEEFRATLTDLKNVAPFAQDTDGLKSLSGLKDDLPFDSQASATSPVKLPQVRTLAFPAVPEAPRLPPTVAISGMKPNVPSWEKYVKEFEVYLQRWDVMNALVLAHFSARLENLSEQRKAKGYGFLAARGDHDVHEYFVSVQQDNDVRSQWNEACVEHEKRLREFMAFREKMK